MCTLSRRVHAPVTSRQQSGKHPVMADNSRFRMFSSSWLTLTHSSHRLHRVESACIDPAANLSRQPSWLSWRNNLMHKKAAGCTTSSSSSSVATLGTCDLRAQTNRVRLDWMRYARSVIRMTAGCDHEQRITSHLNLSSDQCRYDDRMRVRGDFRTLAGLLMVLRGLERTGAAGVF